MLDVVALTPVGTRVNGLQVDALDERAVGDLQLLLAEYGVVILPGQEVGDHAFLEFLRSFGEVVFTTGETPVPGFPDLNVISNVGRTTPPRSTFHTDTSYIRNPPHYTALRAVQVPEHGGHTLFTNQYTAYDTLPTRVREQLAERTITHVVTGLDLDEDAETAAEHPIIGVHPISGRKYLYLSTPMRCAHISDMSPTLVADTVTYLFEHSTRDSNVYRHTWSTGDVVMWDNRCVLHCADHTGVVGDRVMHRGMVVASHDDGPGD
ncbi:MAG: TauD/TfdA family dioxygenase [Mycobacterium sp.]